MPIMVTLDQVLTARGVTSRALAQHVGTTESTICLMRRGKVRGLRFSTLERVCEFLQCQPGDILKYEPAGEAGHADAAASPARSACISSPSDA